MVSPLVLRGLTVVLLIGTGLVSERPDVAGQTPPRLRLSKSADINDWEAYFDYALTLFPRRANAADTALYWASRLDPSRSEPLFGRFVAFWLQDIGRFERYLAGRTMRRDSAAVLAAESLAIRAVHRSPFTPRTLMMHAFDQLPGRWGQDPITQAMIAYGRLDFERAAKLLRQAIARNPERNVQWRLYRATVLVGARQYDSALVEMNAMAATLRARAEQTSSPWYESLEMVDYGIGMLELVLGRPADARVSFQRALQENFAFAPAHLMLGEIALAGVDRPRTIREFTDAANIAPYDGWIQYRLGAALTRLGRGAEAVAILHRAIELEPFFADAYLSLGDAERARGDTTAALTAYEAYLQRAPRRLAEQIDYARRQLTVLRGDR